MAALDLGLSPPRLDWSGAGGPRDLDFQDGYFSDTDGAGESCAVFLAGCHLPQAWQHRGAYVIGELGFGTGLNFLNTWALWRKTRSPGARLHYVSVEAAPFTRQDLRRAQRHFAGLQELAQALQQQWPAAIKGVHRLCLDRDGISLTLFFMDVDEALAQMETPADAWFLDGFAPSRNSAMWSRQVFEGLARLSRPGTRAATFSVAGTVRRGLAAAGFAVRKMPGHGRKRQRLEAVYEGLPALPLRPPTRPRAPAMPGAKAVLVIGGGIAGASLAHAFARRGLAVTMISKNGLADEASGNAAALVSPRLDLDDTPPARFFRTAFAHAVRTYGALGPGIWQPNGMLRLPYYQKDADKFARLLRARALPLEAMRAATAQEGEMITGMALPGTALMLPGAGVVYPQKAIAALSRSARLVRARVQTLERRANGWAALDQHRHVIAAAPLAVLALGAGTLPQTEHLDFRYLKGQVSLGAAQPAWDGPAVLAEGYALALEDGRLLTGADFEVVSGGSTDDAPAALAHHNNLARLRRFAPALAARLGETRLSGRVSVRAATPDQLPYAGPLVDADGFTCRFAALQHGFVDPKAGPAPLQEGLYVLMGLGARGFTLAPILGEAIASEALGEPSPLERGAAEALHPARVLERRLRQHKK